MEQELEMPELAKMEVKIEKTETKKKKITAVKDLPGVGPASIEKLELAGFTDLMSIAVATPGEIVGATEMSEPTAKKIIAIARSSLAGNVPSSSRRLATGASSRSATARALRTTSCCSSVRSKFMVVGTCREPSTRCRADRGAST